MRVKLHDGTTCDIEDTPFTQRAEGQLYWSLDGQHVVKRYLAVDQARMDTLHACLTRFNVHAKNPRFWSGRLGWPNAIVVEPWIGMRMYRVPGKTAEASNYILAKPNLLLQKTKPHMIGDWRGRVAMATECARIVWYALQSEGLCHSDFSGANFLANEREGRIALIDCDGLVIPGKLRPGVLGTPWFMAPEIVKMQSTPNIETDKYAMAVFIYWLLLGRHPLRGKRINSTDADQDDRLTQGEKALYSEHRTDDSNRPQGKYFPASLLGEEIDNLFHKTFVEGLTNPMQRPNAGEWEKALSHLLDRLVPCSNAQCKLKWFPLFEDKPARCPWCGTPQKQYPQLPILQFYSSSNVGIFTPFKSSVLVGWPKQELHIWHVDVRKAFGPTLQESDYGVIADFHFHQSQWKLVNLALPVMHVITVQGVQRVEQNKGFTLEDGMQILFGDLNSPRMATVRLKTMN